MNGKRILNDIIGLMLAIEGFLVLYNPTRSPVATQLYIFGTMLVLFMNFNYALLDVPRNPRRAKKVTTPPPPTPQPTRRKS